ncbi:protein FREE1-like [Typha angustifolia]|uniref:protein FREE1-like n=1 Tax=Typha angustifolia TaxID=59011 RepID=UPI003C2B1362
MQQGSDYSSPRPYYPPYYAPSFPNPNPSPNTSEFPASNPVQSSYASAPSYSPYSYPAYSQNSEVTPSAPSYSQPQFPSYESYQSSPNPSSAFASPYEGAAGRFDQDDGYCNDNSRYVPAVTGEYGKSSEFEQDFYGKKPDIGYRYDQGGVPDDGLSEGVYAYDGGKNEPYGARGTAPSRSSALFDDYGRSISLPSGGIGKEQGSGNAMKIVRAVPKVDAQQDAKNGVQKFRVKLLAEGSGQSTMDVLCQVGLDGIRMLDPTSNRTLRIYSLDTMTKWEVLDSSIFAFWSKSSVDIEPRRIRLKSNSYTTSTILDTVTAASVQFKEMGENSLIRGKGLAGAAKLSEQPTEKKKGLVDWVNLIKPGDEEKDHWVPDEAVSKCPSCGTDFGAFVRRHHCRNCGDIFCDKCTQGRIALTADENAQPVRVCDRCMAEVSQRLSYARESANKPVGLHSHEDLARKLQEEMEKNLNLSSGSKSDGSGRQMREVACPTCTVHLQVQVPASGSETIECGVCQHPFLVSAH